MGNTTSYAEVTQAENAQQTENSQTTTVSGETVPELTQNADNTSETQTTTTTVKPTICIPPGSYANVRIQPKWVHPFIDMVNRNCSEAEMINTLESYCGRFQSGTDNLGRPIYETVDQYEFFGPAMQVFSYCANNGKKSVVQWLLTNFVPLQVSHQNNYCYFECLRWSHYEIADMIVSHESFDPSFEVLENLLSRSKYSQFKKCMSSPYLRDDMNLYRFTFMHYIDNNQYSNVTDLLRKIKQRSTDKTIEISDVVYPNPRFANLNTTAPLVPQPVSEPMEIVESLSVDKDSNQSIDQPTMTETSELVTPLDTDTIEIVVENPDDTLGLHQRVPVHYDNELDN